MYTQYQISSEQLKQLEECIVNIIDYSEVKEEPENIKKLIYAASCNLYKAIIVTIKQQILNNEPNECETVHCNEQAKEFIFCPNCNNELELKENTKCKCGMTLKSFKK